MARPAAAQPKAFGSARRTFASGVTGTRLAQSDDPLTQAGTIPRVALAITRGKREGPRRSHRRAAIVRLFRGLCHLGRAGHCTQAWRWNARQGRFTARSPA